MLINGHYKGPKMHVLNELLHCPPLEQATQLVIGYVCDNVGIEGVILDRPTLYFLRLSCLLGYYLFLN